MDLMQLLVNTNDNYMGCPGVESGIPIRLINVVSTVITVIKFGVPVLLIIFGMLDLGKAVVASKEDEIKKGQQLFIKRAITAVVVFFVIQIVQIIIRFLAGSSTGISQCFNCFVYGKEENTGCVWTGENVESE